MKKYYQITTTIDPKVIGRSSGPYTIKITTKGFGKYAMENCRGMLMYFAHKDTIYEHLPDNLTGTLERKKKCIDYMDYYPKFLSLNAVVSERIKRILEELNVGKNEYILKPITIKNADEPYYLLFVPILDYSELIFPKTVFEDIFPKDAFGRVLVKGEDIVFNSVEEYLSTKGAYTIRKGVLPQKYSEYDILHLPACPEAFFSERILKAFEEAGIVGYDIWTNSYKKLAFDEE